MAKRNTSNKRRRNRSKQRAKRMRAHGHKPGAHASDERVVFIDEWEATDLFRKEGGRKHRSDRSDKISDAPYVARLNGRSIPKPMVPNIMGMERDKASELMQNAADAVAIRERRAALRVDRDAKRDARYLDAERRLAATWHRQNGDMEGMPMFSLLSGTSGGGAERWEDAIVTYRHHDGSYRAGTVSWQGEMSEPDEHGDSHRVGFVFEPFLQPEKADKYDDGRSFSPQGFDSEGNEWASDALSFVDEKHAQRTLKLMLMDGDLESYDRKDPSYRDRIGKSLREWAHRDDEWDRHYVQPAPDAMHVDEVKEPRSDDDWDFQYTAEIGAERNLRDEIGMLTEVQLHTETARDSE